MARFDPAAMAKKYEQGVSNAGAAYIAGINSTEGNPAEMAVAKKDTLKARFNESIDDGTWERNLLSVPKSQWQSAAIAGSSAYTASTKKGSPKYARYAQAAGSIYAANRAQVRQMPNATEADRKARMNANLELMKAMKGVGRR